MRPHLVGVEPADRLLAAVGEARNPAARRVAGEAGDEVLADDRRAVEPHEQFGVEPFLERVHRMMDQPAAPADVEAHVVALGRHPIDVARRDPDQAGQVGGPEFLEPVRGRRGRARRSLFAALRNSRGPASSARFEPLRVDRLHQIIDRLDLERGDRELVEGGDEDDGRRRLLAGERARDVDAVEAGHGDVEQQQVGRQGFGHADRAFAVARRSDQVDVGELREEQLQPFGRKRFVVGDQEPKRRLIHRHDPTAASSGHDNRHQPLGQIHISQPNRSAPRYAGRHWPRPTPGAVAACRCGRFGALRRC